MGCLHGRQASSYFHVIVTWQRGKKKRRDGVIGKRYFEGYKGVAAFVSLINFGFGFGFGFANYIKSKTGRPNCGFSFFVFRRFANDVRQKAY